MMRLMRCSVNNAEVMLGNVVHIGKEVYYEELSQHMPPVKGGVKVIV